MRGTYYWITTIQDGRPVIIGPANSEEEAQNLGFQKLSNDFEVHALNTSNEAEATRMLKAKILNKTADLGKALNKFNHTRNK